MEDYLKLREDLRQKREAIDKMIEAVDEYLSASGVRVNEKPAPKGTFAGMTVIQAAMKYLAMVKRPAPTTEIVAALERGGLEHNAKDFYASVYAILRQQAQKGAKAGIRRNALNWELIEETQTV